MIRHMMRPFRPGDTLEDHAVPMAAIIKQLQSQLVEFRALKEQISVVGPTDASPPSSPSPVTRPPIRRAVFLGSCDRNSNTPKIVDLGADDVDDSDIASGTTIRG